MKKIIIIYFIVIGLMIYFTIKNNFFIYYVIYLILQLISYIINFFFSYAIINTKKATYFIPYDKKYSQLILLFIYTNTIVYISYLLYYILKNIF